MYIYNIYIYNIYIYYIYIYIYVYIYIYNKLLHLSFFTFLTNKIKELSKYLHTDLEVKAAFTTTPMVSFRSVRNQRLPCES